MKIANIVQLTLSLLELQSVEKMSDCYNKVNPVSHFYARLISFNNDLRTKLKTLLFTGNSLFQCSETQQKVDVMCVWELGDKTQDFSTRD